MSIKININFFRESQGLHSQLQTIEGQLDKIQSTRQVSQLTRALDRTCCTLNEMKEKASHVFGQSQLDPLEGVEDKIISMYGRIEEALVSRKVSQIRSEASSIKESLSHGGAPNVKTVNTLKRHIGLFLKDYRPKVQDLQVINAARQTVKEARSLLTGKPTANKVTSGKATGDRVTSDKVTSHFDWLAQQKNVRLIEAIELEPGQYEDLFDIAAMVYNGRLREAKPKFWQLPESLRRSVHQHLRELTAVAFDDELETIQALLATANHLVDNRQPYPTRHQIDNIFLGLREITDAEEKSPVRFSLRTLG